MTKVDYELALKALRAAVAEINLSRSEEAHISEEADAVLFGDGSPLDSIGLVQVVLAAEAHLADASGCDLVLASEAAMSRKRSPYRSLHLLAEYAVEVADSEGLA